jgi:hypothetical protein
MRHVLAIFPLLGCESAPRVVEPSRSARASASSVEGSDPKDWYTCNEDADCVVVKATCGEYDAVRRASAEAASAHYQWQNAGIECVHKELPYPRARCVAQRCVAEVDPTETPRDREARRHAVGDDDAVANLRSTDVLELNYALRHVGDKPELGGSQVAEVSRLLKHETPFVRAAAANALLKLTSPDRAQAADLHVRALDSFGGFDSEPHARALAGFRDQGERIAPDIVQMLNSKSEAIPAFLVALRELGESAKGRPQSPDARDRRPARRRHVGAARHTPQGAARDPVCHRTGWREHRGRPRLQAADPLREPDREPLPLSARRLEPREAQRRVDAEVVGQPRLHRT